MYEKFRSYEVARKIFSILEFVGWCVVVLGLIAGFVMVEGAGRYASEGQQFLLFLSGASGSIVGLFLVGLVQFFRACVDGAEYAQQGLYVAREQLDVSRQLLKKQKEVSHSFAALTAGEAQLPGSTFGSFASSSTQLSSEKSHVGAAGHKGNEVKLNGQSERETEEALDSPKEAHAAIDQKLDMPSLEVAPTIAETQPVQQPNGHEEKVPRSFAELRATKFEEANPKSDAKDVTDDQTELSSLDSEELTSNEELQEFEPPVAELDVEPVEDIEIEAQPAVEETPKRPEPKIEEEDGKFIYGRLSFSSREAAERYVSQLGVNPNFTG